MKSLTVLFFTFMGVWRLLMEVLPSIDLVNAFIIAGNVAYVVMCFYDALKDKP